MTLGSIDAVDFTEYRMSYGLSLYDLAAILGVDARTVRRWETGKAAIPAGITADLATLDVRTAHAAAELAGRSPEDGPVIFGGVEDADSFLAAWPEYEPMPPRWFWRVAALARRRYGIAVEVGKQYAR